MTELVMALRDMWDGDGPEIFAGGMPSGPIAQSESDQAVPSGTDNPLWDLIRWLPAAPYFPGEGPLCPLPHPMSGASAPPVERSGLSTTYSWSIVSPGDVAWITAILAGRSVVEVGAGTGYWAWQLEQAGVDVAAYDPNPVGDNSYATGGPYTTVLRDDASAVRHHQDRALLMVWPPYGGAHATHALACYTGDLLIYAGEEWGGCTADDEFYRLLDTEWDQIDVAPHHVTWWGIHCRLVAYRRKSTGGAS
ncbi:hypothetical protein [Streptomyces sp. NPDC091212]|uniref:hypothetical protein n=1 Tax=Streptomyces sp. NPDC091212 TaxID=3155191 RepID=UPI0034272CA8